MHPHALETLGLSRSLESECASFAQRTGLAVRAAIGTLDARLPADLALAAFRIGQEALRNIEKHARATSARVQLSCSGRELRLVVSDNGVGFRSARASRGIGDPRLGGIRSQHQSEPRRA